MTQCGQRASSTLEFSHYVSTSLTAALNARRDKPGLISILFLQLEILHLARARLYLPFFDASCVTPNTHRPRKPLGLFGALFGRLETTRTSFRYRLCVFYFRIFQQKGPTLLLLGRELDYTRYPKRVDSWDPSSFPVIRNHLQYFSDAFLFHFIIMAADPDCYNVTPDTQSCYPTTDTVIYQNQWTRVVCEFPSPLFYSTSFMLIRFLSGNTRYSLFIGDDGDGEVTLILKNAETDRQVGNWTQQNKLGRFSLAVDDHWWDERATSLWRGQNRNWTFYWQIIPSTHTIDGGEARQPTFVVVQTALPNSALSSSSASIISQSLASASRSIASEDSSSAQAAQQSRDAALQAARNNNYFPPWAIALIVVLGVISIVSILTLVFVLLRGARRKRALDRRMSMGSESPMMQAPGGPVSPAAASTSVSHAGVIGIPPPVRNAPSIRYNDDSINSRANSGSANAEGAITGSDAAIMADAFRKALRKPDFAQTHEEGESPETQGTGETEGLLLNRELAEEGQNIRSVSSERGVHIVADDDPPRV